MAIKISGSTIIDDSRQIVNAGVSTVSALTVTNNITANGNIVGDNSTNITGISNITATDIEATGTFTGDLSGNATSATTATNFTVTGNNGNNETVYLVFVDGSSGSQGAETDTALTYNPSTDTFTAGTFSGAHSGNGAGLNSLDASELSAGVVPAARMSGLYGIESATFTVTANNSANETVYPVFVDGATGAQGAETDTGLSYNPSTGLFTAVAFSGSGANLTSVNAATLDSVDSTSFLRSDAADTKTSGDLSFSDGVRIKMGASEDLNIYHDADNGYSIIDDTGTGDLVIKSSSTKLKNASNQTILAGNGSAVELYNAGFKKFETTSGGVTVTGTVTATTFSGSGASLTNLPASTTITVADESSDTTCFPLFATAATGDLAPKSGSNLTFNSSTGALTATSLTSNDTLTVSGISNLNNDVIFDGASYNASWDKSANTFNFADNAKATFGDGGDLEIYHDASHSYIKDTGTGNLIIYASGFNVANAAGNENMISAANDGAVGLYYDNSLKFETKSDGIDVTGEVQCDSLDVDGAASFNGGNVSFNTDDVDFMGAGSNASWDYSDSKFRINDNTKISFGNGLDLEIYHDGSNSYIDDSGTGVLNIRSNRVEIQKYTGETCAKFAADLGVELYYDNSKKFETKSDGIDVTGEVQCDSLDVDGAADINGHLIVAGVVTATSLDAAISEWVLGANGSSDYTFTGPGLTGAENDPSIYLVRGQKYNFKNSSGGHPFRIQSTPNGSTGTQYNDGITNNDAGNGVTLTWDVQFDAPGVLYYQCTSHADMGGKIYIGNSGESIVVGAAVTINSSGINATGVVTATSFVGDGSTLTGIAAGGSGEFNTGITSSRQIVPLSFETSVFTFPSTAGRQYVIESINVANVDASVGVGTTVNIIASIQDATAAEQTYIAYNVPIATGGLIELLKNPIVAGPSDVIKMWSTNDGYAGVSNATEVYMSYSEFESTDYISKFASTTTINSTDAIALYTSTSNPTVIEKIGFANRTDTGDFPISIKITNGTTTSYLAKDLIIPRYSTVDILDRPKRIETNAKIEVEVGSTSTVDVIISGKKITS